MLSVYRENQFCTETVDMGAQASSTAESFVSRLTLHNFYHTSVYVMGTTKNPVYCVAPHSMRSFIPNVRAILAVALLIGRNELRPYILARRLVYEVFRGSLNI